MQKKFRHALVSLVTSVTLVTPLSLLAAELTNPLGTTDIRVIVARVIQAILGVTGSVALLVFIYGGFMYLISAGDPDKVKKGKNALLYGVIGLAIIVGAYMLVKTVVSALEGTAVA
jgi:type IV secretory pathway VirB2 component (pilin)